MPTYIVRSRMIYSEVYIIDADNELEAAALTDLDEVYPVTSTPWKRRYGVKVSEVPAGYRLNPDSLT